MYESSRGNTNPLSQPAAHTKNKSSLNEVLCTGFYSCHTLIQRLAAGFFLSQQTLIRFYWCHRTDCWLCCLQFKTCFALKQNGGGESPSAVCSRDLQSLQRTYCTWYSFLLCVCVCVCCLPWKVLLSVRKCRRYWGSPFLFTTQELMVREGRVEGGQEAEQLDDLWRRKK